MIEGAGAAHVEHSAFASSLPLDVFPGVTNAHTGVLGVRDAQISGHPASRWMCTVRLTPRAPRRSDRQPAAEPWPSRRRAETRSEQRSGGWTDQLLDGAGEPAEGDRQQERPIAGVLRRPRRDGFEQAGIGRDDQDRRERVGLERPQAGQPMPLAKLHLDHDEVVWALRQPGDIGPAWGKGDDRVAVAAEGRVEPGAVGLLRDEDDLLAMLARSTMLRHSSLAPPCVAVPVAYPIVGTPLAREPERLVLVHARRSSGRVGSGSGSSATPQLVCRGARARL